MLPKYVSVDDFKNYWGKDLRNLLRSDDNESIQAEHFLGMCEDMLMAWIDKNTFRRLRYEDLRGKQLESWKKAIVIHAMYVFKQGIIGMDSGYDAEKGFIAEPYQLDQIVVCQASIDQLSNAGLFNLVMKNRPRVCRNWPGLDEFN